MKPTRLPSPFLGLLAAVTVYALLTSGFSLARHVAFKTHLHDLGLIAQSFWSTTQGEFFVNSVNPEIGRSEYYFGNHFTPIYFLLAPLYWLFPAPATLLIVQSIVIALGAIPVYGLARLHLDSERGALLFALLYLLHPAVWFSNLYDFHAESMSVTFLLYALLYAEIEAWPQFAAASLLAVSCKEHISLFFVMFGLQMALRSCRRKHGLMLAAGALALFAIVNGLLIPAFNRSSSHPYIAERYGHLGSTLSEVVGTALAHPLRTAGLLMTGRHLYYVACLLLPVLFLPLGAPGALLLGLPTFLANGLSALEYTYDIGFYHAASILPGIFLASLRAAGPVGCIATKRLPFLGPRGLAAVLLANAVLWHCQIQSALLPGLHTPLSPWAHRSDFSAGPHERRLTAVRERIPAGASLSAQFDLASQFADRRGLYQFPNRVGEVDAVLVDLTDPYRQRAEFKRFWLEFALQVKVPRYFEALRDLLADRRYGLVLHDDGYLLFLRGAGDRAGRGVALAGVERTAAVWTSYSGRGYGRERHRWDSAPGGGATTEPQPRRREP